MIKPKELTGEVTKFEDGCGYYVSDGTLYGWMVNDNIRDFYTQSFKPEMIEKYFTKPKEVSTEYYNLGIFPRPKSLSDFIDICLSPDIGIKLEWK